VTTLTERITLSTVSLLRDVGIRSHGVSITARQVKKQFMTFNRTKGSTTLITLGAALLSVCISLVFYASFSQGAETVAVNKAFNGREIKVRAGGFIRVSLEEMGAAGYAWHIKNLDKNHFAIVSVETTSTPPGSDVTGAPVMKTWLISTKERGLAVLKFLHYRPWEGEEHASETFVLNVRIL